MASNSLITSGTAGRCPKRTPALVTRGVRAGRDKGRLSCLPAFPTYNRTLVGCEQGWRVSEPHTALLGTVLLTLFFSSVSHTSRVRGLGRRRTRSFAHRLIKTSAVIVSLDTTTTRVCPLLVTVVVVGGGESFASEKSLNVLVKGGPVARRNKLTKPLYKVFATVVIKHGSNKKEKERIE